MFELKLFFFFFLSKYDAKSNGLWIDLTDRCLIKNTRSWLVLKRPLNCLYKFGLVFSECLTYTCLGVGRFWLEGGTVVGLFLCRFLPDFQSLFCPSHFPKWKKRVSIEIYPLDRIGTTTFSILLIVSLVEPQ